MKSYKTDQIRNISFIGNGGTGKTSLLEAILFNLGANSRLGRVDDGTSVCDYQPEETKKKMSMVAKLVTLEKGELKYNFCDTPGFDDFQAEVKRVVPVTENIVMVLDPGTGIVGHTEKVWEFAAQTKNFRSFFINKLDKERADFFQMLGLVQETFGKYALPVFIPIGREQNLKGVIDLIQMKAYLTEGDNSKEAEIPADLKEEAAKHREKLMETAAETNEALMEKYFADGTLSSDEFLNGLRLSYQQGTFFPVFCGSAYKNIGARELFLNFELLFSSPAAITEWKGINSATHEEAVRKLSETEPVSLFIYKTQQEQHTGELVFFKVISGLLKTGMDLLNTSNDNSERINQVLSLRGKEKVDICDLCPGDLGITMKLRGSYTSQTLSDPKNPISYPKIEFPNPVLSIAIVPKTKVDQEKCSAALAKISEEDPTFRMQFMAEFSQLVIYGMGESHLNNIIDKLKTRYNVQVDVDKPRITYRETIKKKTGCEKKYKKQSGGRGQYGHVVMEIAPMPIDKVYEFEEKIFGGSIPGKYIPSIEKGVKEAIEHGVLAGCPVIGIHVAVLDGSYHDVDSSDIAFKIAGSIAMKDGMEKANPVLLEPIMEIEVKVPEEFMGDIMGDLNSRRGRILGMGSHGKSQTVKALVPEAELYKYINNLKSMTQGKGTFAMKFDHYEEVPANLAQNIVEELKKFRVAEAEK
ncbi:MAG: elongation factor G [Candidatus Wallbacteria bacterium]|nr:elongation factor G [Candidatus Wallbacteria bacterium]